MPREWTDLSEKDVVKQCYDLLAWDGWTVINQPSGLFSRPGDPQARIRTAEVGASDKICVRRISQALGLCQFFYLELKAPGEEPSPQQKQWIAQKRRDGYLCVVVDSLEQLQQFLEDRFPRAI